MVRDFNRPRLQLAALTLHPRHHRAALWWLGWLYRNPASFGESIEGLQRGLAVRSVLALYVHSFPWIFVALVAIKILSFHAGFVHADWAGMPVSDRWMLASWEVG